MSQRQFSVVKDTENHRKIFFIGTGFAKWHGPFLPSPAFLCAFHLKTNPLGLFSFSNIFILLAVLIIVLFVTYIWCMVKELSRRRRYLAAVMHDANVYAVGGYDGTTRLNTVDCLKFTKGKPSWVSSAPLNVKRGLPGATVLNGKLRSAVCL